MAAKNDVPHTDALASSRILIIGGTSGIGFAVASGTLAAQAHVFVSSSSKSKVDQAVSRLKALYPKAHISGTAADLSDPKTLEANIRDVLNKAIEATGGPLDHIVSTAGARLEPVPLQDATPADAINPSVQTLRVLMPLMIGKFVAKYPNKYLTSSSLSSLTLTSGILVKKPMPGMASLIALGAQVEGLSRAFAVDMKPIRVNLVTPGAIDTELLENNERFRAARKLFEKATLVNSVGRPRDAAEAYLFCMRSGYITGQEIVVDGGALLMNPVA